MPTFICETCNASFYGKFKKGMPRKFCSIRCRGLSQSRKRHPGLDEKYFEWIDTAEKAYWLGFLYADGCIVDQRGTLALQVTLSRKDEDQIDRFIKSVGASPTEKRLTETTASIMIFNQQFTRHLVAKGCGPRKTDTIRLPLFGGDHIAKAFLLGFFDGDGCLHSPESKRDWRASLSCGSKAFLEDVARIYFVEKEVKLLKNPQGSCWTLNLGREFYRELLANYEHSMPRKRISI